MSNAALPSRQEEIDAIKAIALAHNDLCERTSRCLDDTAIAHNKLVAVTTDLLDQFKKLKSQLEVEKSKTEAYELRLQALERHKEIVDLRADLGV